MERARKAAVTAIHLYVMIVQSYAITRDNYYCAPKSDPAAAPAKYFAVDNGLRRANSPQLQPDLGHRLENAVALHLRRQTRDLLYAGERNLWECDFIIPDAAIQVFLELTAANRPRELQGVIEGTRLRGRRRAIVVTLDQTDRLIEGGTEIEVLPAWRWMA